MDSPKIINKKMLSKGVDLTLEMSPTLDAFKGHFESKPIIPGVVQIHWALKYALLYIEEVNDIEVEQINALKFHNIITPSSTIELKLRLINEQLVFSYTSQELKHSSGKIIIH